MAKICDNTSVGQIIELLGEDLRRIVVIDRANYPQAKALPAGHEDGVEGDAGVRKEVAEEVGLTILENELVFTGRIENPCKREGGDYHEWKVYRSFKTEGELKAGSDAKKAAIVTLAELHLYAIRTEYFMHKCMISYDEVYNLTRSIFGHDPSGSETDPEWKQNPGLEPVWYFILRQLGYFDWPAPTIGASAELPAKEKC